MSRQNSYFFSTIRVFYKQAAMRNCRTPFRVRRLDSSSLIADLCEFYDDFSIQNKDNLKIIFRQRC